MAADSGPHGSGLGSTWLPTLARTVGCRPGTASARRPRPAAPLSLLHQSGVPSPSGWSCKFCWADDRCACRHRSSGDKTGAGRGRGSVWTEQRADWAAHGTGHGARREGCEGLGRVGRGCWCRAGEGDAPGRVLGGPRLSIAVTRGSVSKREATSVLAGALVDWLLVLRGRCRSELCPGRSPRGLWPHSVTAHPARRSRWATSARHPRWATGPPSAAGHPGPSSAAGHAICRPGRSTRPAVPSSPARRIARSPQP